MSAVFPYPTTTEDFRVALSEIQERIQAAASPGQSVRLLPVSKTVPADRLRHAIEAGCTVLGENKAQEALAKSEKLADTGISWSIIGHLQSNKAKYIARFADEFQALDSLKLAEILHSRLDSEDRVLRVFIQVNTSGEPQKAGIDPAGVDKLLERMPEFPRLRVVGLMTMARNSTDQAVVRSAFERLRLLRDVLSPNVPEGVSLRELSMGMSGDFELAIQEGSTCVRIGRALFGHRD